MLSNLVHLIMNLNISYPYLIKFHDFVDKSQEGMKDQVRGAPKAQWGMTLHITLLCRHFSPQKNIRFLQLKVKLQFPPSFVFICFSTIYILCSLLHQPCMMNQIMYLLLFV
jgi:hypothetical protein